MNKHIHVLRAATLLASEVESDLPYAALELRMAMEVIAYEKLRLYAPRLPESIFDKMWQPPQIMKALLEFEPLAMENKTISSVRTAEDGSSTEQVVLGEHFSFKLKWFRKAYNTVGQLLHTPTPKQAEQTTLTKATDPTKRDTLLKILCEVERVVASQLDSSIAKVIEFECLVCNSPVIRNEESTRVTQRAICLKESCAAEHLAEFSADGDPTFRLIATDFDCVTCKKTFPVQHRKLAVEYEFSCPFCRADHIIATAEWSYGLKSDVIAVGA